jgi:hypothetical protein
MNETMLLLGKINKLERRLGELERREHSSSTGPGSTNDNAKDHVAGRLTLLTAVPATIDDVTAATTLYFTPFRGNAICIYNGATWDVVTFSEISLNISGFTADKNYDIFAYNNSGTLTLEGLVWTNGINRATGISLQDGIYVKTGDATRRYLGTIRITGVTGQCEDSLTKRYVWNYYHRLPRLFRLADDTSHTYGSDTWRFWNDTNTWKIYLLVGVVEEPINIFLKGALASATVGAAMGLAYDAEESWNEMSTFANDNTGSLYLEAAIAFPLELGYHWLSCVEAASEADCAFTYFNIMGTING